MIRVLPIGSFLKESPFKKEWDWDTMKSHEVRLVSDEQEADLIVAGPNPGFHGRFTFRRLLPLMLKYGNRKKYLLWTDEPRFDLHFIPIVQYPLLPKVHIFNVFTGAYINNYRWLRAINLQPLMDFEFKHRRVVTVMLYRKNAQEWSLKYNGKELDLYHLRNTIALEGHSAGIMDIYGKGWPEGVALGQSREGEWRQKKQEILQDYHFNLAFENTNWPYYCTEKIWDAIQAGCLPIYYGEENAIYEDFPRDSFIDYCEFGEPYNLFSFIQSISSQDFIKRMNLCIEVYNTAVKKQQEKEGGWEELAVLTAQRIQDIMNHGISNFNG
jgi:hypothetical protein